MFYYLDFQPFRTFRIFGFRPREHCWCIGNRHVLWWLLCMLCSHTNHSRYPSRLLCKWYFTEYFSFLSILGILSFDRINNWQTVLASSAIFKVFPFKKSNVQQSLFLVRCRRSLVVCLLGRTAISAFAWCRVISSTCHFLNHQKTLLTCPNI